MTNREELDMSSALQRRRQKFSRSKIDEIRNDLLHDVGLLSRSTDGNNQLKSLRTDQTKRDQLLNQIKSESTDANYEHGLRKLRETIVSIFSDNNNDDKFIAFTEEVYIMSYDFFLRTNQLHKIGGIVLEFMKDNLHELFIKRGFFEVYIIYLSHIEGTLAKTIEILMQYKEEKRASFQFLLKLSTIYCQNISSPVNWFQTIRDCNFKETYPSAYELLRRSNKVAEMQERCLNIAKVSYNQLSLKFFEEYWLCGYTIAQDIRSTMESTYTMKENQDGSQTIMFKVQISHIPTA